MLSGEVTIDDWLRLKLFTRLRLMFERFLEKFAGRRERTLEEDFAEVLDEDALEVGRGLLES